jgi:hypothetical protein
MSPVQKIINHSIAGPFYRQQAGAFLFLFFILFGIQPSLYDALRTHYAIISGILTSINFFLVTIACWIFYTIRTIIFVRGCLQKESYDFLFHLNAVKPLTRFGILLQVNSLLHAPLIGYRLLILIVGIKDNSILQGILAFATITILISLATIANYYYLSKAKALQEITTKRFTFLLPKTLTSFVLRYVFRKQFVILIIVKLLSFGCLYFFARTEASVFEERMIWLLYLTSLIGHSVIVYKNFHFIEAEMCFYRNMPVKSIVTILSLLAVYAILMIPEAWALRAVAVSQGNVTDYIWMILTGPSLLLLLHSLLYTEDMTMEEYLKLLFGVWVVFVFFSLSRHHWILPAISLVFGAIIFLISYYKYEKNTEIEGLE